MLKLIVFAKLPKKRASFSFFGVYCYTWLSMFEGKEQIYIKKKNAGKEEGRKRTKKEKEKERKKKGRKGQKKKRKGTGRRKERKGK